MRTENRRETSYFNKARSSIAVRCFNFFIAADHCSRWLWIGWGRTVAFDSFRHPPTKQFELLNGEARKGNLLWGSTPKSPFARKRATVSIRQLDLTSVVYARVHWSRHELTSTAHHCQPSINSYPHIFQPELVQECHTTPISVGALASVVEGVKYLRTSCVTKSASSLLIETSIGTSVDTPLSRSTI